MLDESAKHLALHLLRDSQMALAADFHRQQSIRVFQGEHERMAGQGDMDRFLAQLIQHAGYLLIAPQSAARPHFLSSAPARGEVEVGRAERDTSEVLRWATQTLRSRRERGALLCLQGALPCPHG